MHCEQEMMQQQIDDEITPRQIRVLLFISRNSGLCRKAIFEFMKKSEHTIGSSTVYYAIDKFLLLKYVAETPGKPTGKQGGKAVATYSITDLGREALNKGLAYLRQIEQM